MTAIDALSQLAFLMFIGLIVGIVAKKLRVPSMLLLILTGAILSNISIDGQQVFQLSQGFLISASILALVMIVFRGSSTFSLRDLDTYSESAAKIAIIFLVLNILFLSVSVYFLFGIGSMLLSLLFAAVMSGTDPGSVLSLFQTKSNKIIEILKFESVINTPVVVLLPFILLDLMALNVNAITSFLEYFYPFLQQIITGIGTGVVIALVVFRFMRRFYVEKISPFTLITTALLTYVLSENLGGNGVLAVTVLGVFFGNVTVKKKEELQEFSGTLSYILEILVFILIGFLIPNTLSFWFIFKSLILFFVLLAIRFASIQIVFLHDHVNLKERIFMSLNASKGIAVAVVAFILTNYSLERTIAGGQVEIPLTSLPGTVTVINLMVLFILYSIILSSIAARFSQKFIRLKVEE